MPQFLDNVNRDLAVHSLKKLQLSNQYAFIYIRVQSQQAHKAITNPGQTVMTKSPKVSRPI